MIEYADFLNSKLTFNQSTGFEPTELNSMLFDFQTDITRWAIRIGKAAIFADCGLGKTPMQLEWGKQVHENTQGNVLILAPLAVSQQTKREGDKFGIRVNVARSMDDIVDGVNITNYEMLSHFDPDQFSGVVLDESSILKNFSGKMRTEIIESFEKTSYKLACTATPAPNDHMELSNHAEFLGVMTRQEMLSMFFVHDGSDTSKWRIKGNAQSEFWKWLCSFAVMIRKPSDLGYDDDGFILPAIKLHEHVTDASKIPDGYLFPVEALTLQERLSERRSTIETRSMKCAELINGSNKQWIVWCNLNAESSAAARLIDGAVEIVGSDKREKKEDAFLRFTSGDIRVLVTKPRIGGFGMNWQHCHNVAFLGLSDSYEQYYQAVRRCWRFGQTEKVNVHIITAETEGAVLQNIKRKEKDAERMAISMVDNMSDLNEKNIKGTEKTSSPYKTELKEGDGWSMYHGDCVDMVKNIKDESIHYTIFSPPFESLYTYSNSERDMGNCRGSEDFATHFKFLIPELMRVTKPGRLLSFHCMNLPATKQHQGYIGIRDFRGALIQMFIDEGWIYHSEVVIWKDPVVAMQRTKALGLLHKQLKKDACMSRQGIPDYLVTMRKPGENPEPVTNTDESFPVKIWQRYASPIWTDINQSNTLQKRSAREHDDERHIAPLQLQVIQRGLEMWTNPSDLVFSPFAGIGSEGYVALNMGRQFVGIELKESYFKEAVRNLEEASGLTQKLLFGREKSHASEKGLTQA